jgi:HPt (histidine-containing phosphotransfer) domain-containing protein
MQSTREIDEDSELPPRLVDLFLAKVPPSMSELATLCTQRKAEAAAELAHKIKGSLYAAGASSLANAIEQLRSLLKQTHWSDVDRELAVVHRRFEQVLVELKAGKPP